MIAQLLMVTSVWAQAEKSSAANISFFYDILGHKGLLATIGILFFFVTYKYSKNLFAWIEDQTYGTRD